jgi:Spy/CpxP family protein refolding chaperone
VCGLSLGTANAQAEDRPAAAPADSDGESRPRRFHVLPPFAERELALTAEQQREIEALDDDVQSRLNKILTPEQQKKWNQRRPWRGVEADQPGQNSRRDRPRRGGDAPRGDRPTERGGGDDVDSSRREAAGRGSDDTPARRPRDGRGSEDRPARPQGSDRRDRAPGGGPLERVVGQLKLDADQRARVDVVLKEHHEKVRGLFRQAQADLLASMKQVLTDEQFAEFAKALENGPPGFHRRPRSGGDTRDEDRPSER